MTLDQVVAAKGGVTFTVAVANMIANFDEDTNSDLTEELIRTQEDWPDAATLAPFVPGVQSVMDRLGLTGLDPEVDAVFTPEDAKVILLEGEQTSAAISDVPLSER